MRIGKIVDIRVALFVSLAITLSFVQPLYGGAFGKTIVLAGGEIILEFVGGFANRMGQEAAERIIRNFPPPPPQKRKWVYAGDQGGYLSYELLGRRGGALVYRATSNNFSEFDNQLEGIIRDLRRNGIISSDEEKYLLRPYD